jgi:hypothetical protein
MFSGYHRLQLPRMRRGSCIDQIHTLVRSRALLVAEERDLHNFQEPTMIHNDDFMNTGDLPVLP